MTLYLETDPLERAMEAKQKAKLAVAAYRAKDLPTAIPTVIRDLERNESEQANERDY